MIYEKLMLTDRDSWFYILLWLQNGFTFPTWHCN